MHGFVLRLRNRRFVIIAGLIFVVVSCSIYAVYYLYVEKTKAEKNTFLKIIPDNVDLQIKNIHYTEVGDPDLKWEINADSVRYVKKDNLAYFDNVRIKLITAKGRELVMTGKEGCLHTDNNNAEIYGDVKVVSNNGDTFTTDRLNYTAAGKTIHTDGQIVMKSPRLEIRGTGMTLFVTEERVTLLSGVKADIPGKSK